MLGSAILPDPFTLIDGWLNEEGRVKWPSLYFSDIAAYLQMTTPAELVTDFVTNINKEKDISWLKSYLSFVYAVEHIVILSSNFKTSEYFDKIYYVYFTRYIICICIALLSAQSFRFFFDACLQYILTFSAVNCYKTFVQFCLSEKKKKKKSPIMCLHTVQ